MISYEVTLGVEPSLASRVEEYMRRTHIPAIFATACFRRIRFWESSAGQFRTSYEAINSAALDSYLGSHAARLRAEFQAEFPAGVSVIRNTWMEREVWD